MARAPSEEPQDLVYEPELLSVDEEAGLRELPDWLLPVRERAAGLAGHEP